MYHGGVNDAGTLRPKLLSALEPDSTELRHLELDSLKTLQVSGIAIAPLAVVPAGVEERFYRLNNLASQLEALFHRVDPSDPDEDDLEELAPEALALFKAHFLLDEFIDLFYEVLKALPEGVHVRRPSRAGLKSVRGRPALVALKATWAEDWSFETLSERLSRTQRLALEARPVLLSPAAEAPASPEVAAQVQRLLGRPVKVWASDLGVSRLSFEMD